MMFIRAQMGSQYLSWSSDGGDTWSEPKASDIVSPLSPASIKRIPKTGDLLMVEPVAAADAAALAAGSAVLVPYGSVQAVAGGLDVLLHFSSG
jgi:hypothetical protein